nr:YadA C-terminal domain-containing protein [Neisseria cinerea]
MKHFQSKVLTAAILAALSGSAIAADVYLKNEVYSKEEVNTEIADAKTAVEEKITAAEGKITAAEGKITAAEGKITAAEDKITAAEGKITAAEDKITAAEGKITTLEEKTDKAKETAEKAKEAADKAQKGINDIDTKVKAAEKAVENAENAAKKVTDIKEAAGAALLAAYKNAQDINGFKAGDDIYDIDEETGKITKKPATQEDVENDDFAGLGLKEIVGQHDENLENLTETVNKNSETLDNTVDVVNQHTEDLTAVKTAINKNEDAINDTKDDLALVAATAINNAQEINGFKAGEDIYDIDEKTGKITKKPATDTDVEADDLKGKGLKKVVVEHDQSLKGLTETVKKNTDDIATKAEKTELDKVSKKADKNADDIATKADKTELDKVSKKADKNADDIATKADKANVYTKTESDSRFVKVESSIGGLDTTTKGLDTRLTSAEKSVADHGTRLASAEKSITEHGTRLNGLDKAVSDLRKETRQGLAEQAALSGLFQPYNVGRFNVTAAVGGYKSESAVAIGTGFRFTENFAAKAGVAVGTSSGSSAAYHVGVNYEW